MSLVVEHIRIEVGSFPALIVAKALRWEGNCQPTETAFRAVARPLLETNLSTGGVDGYPPAEAIALVNRDGGKELFRYTRADLNDDLVGERETRC